MKDFLIFLSVITYVVAYSCIGVFCLGLNQKDYPSLAYNIFGGVTAGILMLAMADPDFFKGILKRTKR